LRTEAFARLSRLCGIEAVHKEDQGGKEMNLNDKVEIVNCTNPERNGMKGIIAHIWPAGMFTDFTIIQVDHGNGKHGQFPIEQIKVLE
jgi:hypothetical protein